MRRPLSHGVRARIWALVGACALMFAGTVLGAEPRNPWGWLGAGLIVAAFVSEIVVTHQRAERAAQLGDQLAAKFSAAAAATAADDWACTVPGCLQYALRRGGNCAAHKHAPVGRGLRS